MNVHRYPPQQAWPGLLARPVLDSTALEELVRPVLADIKNQGDKAVRKYTLQFDKVVLEKMEVSQHEINFALDRIQPQLLEAIKTASANITAFHRSQMQAPEKISTMPGVVCWRKNVGLERVGLYIPGGTAPLFSTVLMLAIPAVLAECREIIICSPPDTAGHIHPAILAAAAYIGISRIYTLGGVQAIGAMAYGTETIPKVNKIFGPGNQYVTIAKQLVSREGVPIDMPAGPSEVAVYADETAHAEFVAADLLSQAEHGVDSQVILVTDHEPMIDAVQLALARQLDKLPRKNIASRSLQHSKVFLVRDRQEAMDMLNAYAPEHLILACQDAEALSDKVVNAGSVFLGHYSPESAGDYASGTNHTLPTNGHARTFSGVSVDSFVKKITFQELTPEGLENIAATVETMAEAEGLFGHAEAVRVRLKQ